MKKIINAGAIFVQADGKIKVVADYMENSTVNLVNRLIPFAIDIARCNPSLESIILPATPDLQFEFEIYASEPAEHETDRSDPDFSEA